MSAMQAVSLTTEQERALAEQGVMTVYLFGSFAQGIATERSDIDFAVLMRDAAQVKPEKDILPIYQVLYRILSDVVPGARTVDIVFLQNGVSLELQGNVVRHGKLLMDLEPLKRGAYEEQVMMRAADFAPILRIMDKAILERI